jgi:hypothetical protein
VLSAAFAAVAASAAWRSVAVSLSLQRAARRPHVSGAILHSSPSNRLTLTFACAGPVLAVQVMYFLVAEGQKRGGLVADGHLDVGEKEPIDPGIVSSGIQAPAYLVWTWRDLDDNVHIRDSDWKYKRISRRTWLRRKDTTLGGTFREMYPDVPIPA